jgi:FkbM family methyltransferase
MTPLRLKVMWYYLTGKKNNVTAGQILGFFFGPSYKSKAKNVITALKEAKDYNMVMLKGFESPLYFPSGFPYSSLQQVVCECFYPDNWHYYEIPQTRVTPNDIVVDCGAAEGLFGFIVVNRCKQIYLIEPVAEFCKSLSKTFAGQNNVVILPVALSSTEGKAVINEHDIASTLAFEGEGTIVDVTLLDKLFYEKNIAVSYIKIDLEGYDLEALKGGAELIRTNKPKIAVTTYHNRLHAETIRQYLLSLVPEYNILVKGIYQETGSPVMLHAWI